MKKVSVITISYNCEKEIVDTLKSVISQDFTDLEYVVVDGQSSDATPSIIKKYSDKIDVYVSEPDKGIYDAMNKGVQLASGEWIIFMNAGDIFYDNNTISAILSKVKAETEMLYGDHEVVYEHLTKVKKASPPDLLWKGMICSHQALFAKRDLLLKYPFDWKNWKISADFHFIFNRWIDGVQFQYVPVFVTKFAAGGLSDIGSIDSKIETWKIVTEKKNTPEINQYYKKLLRYEKGVNFLRKNLPTSIFEKLMKLKNKLKGEKVK